MLTTIQSNPIQSSPTKFIKSNPIQSGISNTPPKDCKIVLIDCKKKKKKYNSYFLCANEQQYIKNPKKTGRPNPLHHEEKKISIIQQKRKQKIHTHAKTLLSHRHRSATLCTPPSISNPSTLPPLISRSRDSSIHAPYRSSNPLNHRRWRRKLWAPQRIKEARARGSDFYFFFVT